VTQRGLIIEPKELAAIAASIADSKKGVELRVLDVSDQIKVADYFVLVTGTSRPHVKALVEAVRLGLKALGQRNSKIEGGPEGWWVLIDYLDVVVHVLQPEARDYYDIDHLYGDCPELDWQSVPLPEEMRSKPA
jgi:ribosome-associated protein